MRMRPAGSPMLLLSPGACVKDYHADGGVVRAVRGVDLAVDAGRVRRHHGAVRIGQVNPAARHRRP